MMLILYGRADCHLCDRLEALIEPYARASVATIEKRDIGDRPKWQELYSTRIPVLLAGDRVILEGRPNEKDVKQAFENLSIRSSVSQ